MSAREFATGRIQMNFETVRPMSREDWVTRRRIRQRLAEKLLAEEPTKGPMSDKTVRNIAAICHEANRVYCAAVCGECQPFWLDAPEWQQKSAEEGVRFHMENPHAGASASHESWFAHKVADGWKYGPVKNPEKKEHPCMVPFNQLPEDQQRKDMLFRAIVHALADPVDPADKPFVDPFEFMRAWLVAFDKAHQVSSAEEIMSWVERQGMQQSPIS